MDYSGESVVTVRERKMRDLLLKCMAKGREDERELKGLKELLTRQQRLLAKSASKPSSTKTKQLLKDTAHAALRAKILDGKRLI